MSYLKSRSSFHPFTNSIQSIRFTYHLVGKWDPATPPSRWRYAVDGWVKSIVGHFDEKVEETADLVLLDENTDHQRRPLRFEYTLIEPKFFTYLVEDMVKIVGHCRTSGLNSESRSKGSDEDADNQRRTNLEALKKRAHKAIRDGLEGMQRDKKWPEKDLLVVDRDQEKVTEDVANAEIAT